MPQPTRNAPDAHDVYNMLCSVGEEYNMYVVFDIRYTADHITTIARSYGVKLQETGGVVYQAMSSRPYGSKVEQHQINYGLAFDIWCQADGAGATAAKRGAPRLWDGRPERLRRRSGS
jgi:hypothetical protein